jgi:multidrug efflux system membrane fusion protein
MLILFLLVVGGLGYAWYYYKPFGSAPATTQGRQGRFGGGGPMTVSMARVASADMPVILNALGTVTPLATVTVRAQVSGQITQIAFREGQMVQKGDFLVEIDPRSFRLALEQAQGTLARDEALLKNAEIDLARYKTLVAQDSIARQQRDTQEALVRQYQGVVQADRAIVDNAKLNLSYTRVVAPISGRVGLRVVDQGNYITAGDSTGLVVITQLQPISAIFSIPEDSLAVVRDRMRGGATLEVTAFNRARSATLAKGTVSTTDNQIDTTTGTVRMRAIFENTDEALFPNQFVNVRLLVDTLKDATIVPASAIQRGTPGTFVYVVKREDMTVSVRPIKLGPSEGERLSVTDGLRPGEMVVTDGGDRLREGATVRVPTAQGGTNPGAASPQGPAGQGGDRPRRQRPDGAAPADGQRPQGERPQGERRGPPAASPQ